MRPDLNRVPEFYHNYINQVKEDDLATAFANQTPALMNFLESIPKEKYDYAYAAGKWTIKEVLQHLIDGERIFGYRVLRISRGDETPIEGFEQDGYIENSNANNRCFADLLDEFDLQRRANLHLLKNISDKGSRRLGTASEKRISVRALAYIMAGHVEHHIGILNDRYLAE